MPGSLAEEIMVAHMFQHQWIGEVAALLLIIGFTGTLLQRVLALPSPLLVRHLASGIRPPSGPAGARVGALRSKPRG